MKSILSYYYGLSVEKIDKKNNGYYIFSKKIKYMFLKVDNIKYKSSYLYKLNIELLKNNEFFHEIVLNRYNSPITYDDDISYVLMKINLRKNRYIEIEDILKLQNPLITTKDIFQSLDYSNWLELWKQKINYFEYYTNNMDNDNYSFFELINYFIGLGENAISYLQETLISFNNLNNRLVINHDRIKKNSTLWDLYNPLSIVLDNRVRDISEYFKDNIVSVQCDEKWIKKNISICNLNEIECRLLFARMLFPSFFFDEYEFFINKKINEKELLNIIDKIERYEKNMYIIYEEISNKYKIPSVEWIKKTTN